MKIGLVCPYNLFRGGGVQEMVLCLADELRERGHEVKIITPRPYGYKGEPPEGMIFAGQSAKWNTPIKTTLEVGGSFDVGDLGEMLVEEDFDVLHVHEPEVPILGAQVAAKATCPIVATFHAMLPETPVARTIEVFRIPYARSIFKNIAFMTAVSEPAATFVREWSGQDITIIPNCIDVASYSTTKRSSAARRPNIVYIGRLEKRKGVRYLLQAFAELAAQDEAVSLIIAGDGPERERLETWTSDNQVPRVSFVGYVDDKAKHQLLRDATVFCSPAIYGESFGIVLLEAMAAGVPIVAGDNPGYASVLQGRGELSLVNPKDTAEFARRLRLMLHDQPLRDMWQAWAAEYISRFDIAVVVSEYEKMYERALVRQER